jgi:hypothetical protein
MKIEADSPQEYLDQLPETRQEAMARLRDQINSNLPAGFVEVMSYGMIGWVVPHSVYPDGYHCTPKLPLPFMNIASQKNFVAVYHMGIYADPALMKWFTSQYPMHCDRKLDMGKSCIRFKKPELIPFDLIGQLADKMTVNQWIKLYEEKLKK